MIIATLFLAATLGRTEEALRASMYAAMQHVAGQVRGAPEIIDRTLQPESDYVEAMANDVPDAELREEAVKEHAPVSLRSIWKTGRKLTSEKDVESVIRDGTPQERVDRFKKRYPYGVLRLSAVGQMPNNKTGAFVTFEWLTARVDKNGDFQLQPAEIGLIELVPDWQHGWKVETMHPVALYH